MVTGYDILPFQAQSGSSGVEAGRTTPFEYGSLHGLVRDEQGVER